MKPDKQSTTVVSQKRGGSARPVKNQAISMGSSLGISSQVPPKNFDKAVGTKGKADPSPSNISKSKRGESHMIKTNNLIASADGGSSSMRKKVPNSTKE